MADSEEKKMLPPQLFLIALLAQAALHWILPFPQVITSPIKFAGIALVLLGIWIASSSSQLFARLGTAIRPFENSSVLVTSGWYRFSRNPMYVALLMILVGVAVLLGSVQAFLPLLVLAPALHYRFIRKEEEMLTVQFGDEYVQFCRRIRRWI